MVSEKVCIVAGGGRGIGHAVAVALGQSGAKVVVNDLGTSVEGDGKDINPANETVNEIREQGGEGIAHHGDITSFEYTEHLVEDTLDEYGRIDGLINTAGVIRDNISYKINEDDGDKVIDVHLRGHFSLIRNCMSHWREQSKEGNLNTQRSIVCVSSDAALGNPGQANYSAAKAGVLGLMRTIAREYDRSNVRVNAVMPRAYTRMTEQIPEEKRPYTREERPPEKITPLFEYLISDESIEVTGNTFLAAGDVIGLLSDPEFERIASKDSGWSVTDVQELFDSSFSNNVELNKTQDQIW